MKNAATAECIRQAVFDAYDVGWKVHAALLSGAGAYGERHVREAWELIRVTGNRVRGESWTSRLAFSICSGNRVLTIF